MTTTDMYLNVSQDQLLEERGATYDSFDYNHSMVMTRARPIFNYTIIDEMIMDPRVMFGLLLIKGPIIANTQFGVKCQEQEATDFIISQINQFWNQCVNMVLDGIEWGFSANEVLYEQLPDGSLGLKGMNAFKARDVRVIMSKGKRTGISVQNIRCQGYSMDNVYLGGPKHFHYVHWRKYNKHYGRSRLFSTLVPWWEIWAKGGFRDTRRLWFAKNAFNGGMVRYPKGKTNVPGRGEVDNHILALDMAVKMMTGAVTVAPSSRTGQMRDGEWDWMFEGVKPNSIPGGLMEYGGLLRVEILESMGIPYEVVESSGNEGFGSSSGRSIPLLAYNAILFEIVQDLMKDFKEQILNTLLFLKFKRKIAYEIIPMPLQTPDQEEKSPNTTEEDDKDQSGKVNGAPKKSAQKKSSMGEPSNEDESGDDSEDGDEGQESKGESKKSNDSRRGVARAL